MPNIVYDAMRVSGIKVLAKLIELARNICFWQRDTKVFAFWILNPSGSWDGNAAKRFLALATCYEGNPSLLTLLLWAPLDTNWGIWIFANIANFKLIETSCTAVTLAVACNATKDSTTNNKNQFLIFKMKCLKSCNFDLWLKEFT